MTDVTYGWDTSHYDDPPTSADGIQFFTHKLTDGDHYYEDPEFKSSVEAMRSFGVSILGAYHVLHGQASIVNQAAWLIQRLDALVPWWRSHPCFIIQCDAEPFNYLTTPTVAQINAFLAAVVKLANLPNERGLAYAPNWHYQSALTGLQFAWWSSNYGSNPTGHYPDIYPGNSSTRWNGPVNALILQYGSNAIIANQTTCDANAFAGTLVQLMNKLKASGTSEGDNDMGAYVLSNFGGQPDWTQGAYHVQDNSAQGYHVAPREPAWNAICWPNAPRLSPTNVPTKYDYGRVCAALFGPGAPTPPPADSGVTVAQVTAIAAQVSDARIAGTTLTPPAE